jgi:hypothetical protein
LLLKASEGMGGSDDVILGAVDILVVIILPFDVNLQDDIGSPVAKVSACRPGFENDIDWFGMSVGFGRDFDGFNSAVRVLCNAMSADAYEVMIKRCSPWP